MNIKACPSCGAAAMVYDTRDLPYTYKGETTTLPAVTGDFCTACDESILDAAQSRRSMQMMLAFTKQVNAAIVDPAFIASVRKKLELDQREAAELFGGGVNAFSRYENGKPSRRWPWSNCSRCWTGILTCWRKCGRGEGTVKLSHPKESR